MFTISTGQRGSSSINRGGNKIPTTWEEQTSVVNDSRFFGVLFALGWNLDFGPLLAESSRPFPRAGLSARGLGIWGKIGGVKNFPKNLHIHPKFRVKSSHDTIIVGMIFFSGWKTVLSPKLWRSEVAQPWVALRLQVLRFYPGFYGPAGFLNFM